MMDFDESDETAIAMMEIARALNRLGNNGAVTPMGTEMGGLEALGVVMAESADKTSDALYQIADALRRIGEEMGRARDE